MTSLRSSNASRNQVSTHESGWIDRDSQENGSRVGINKIKTEQSSVKSSTTEVEMNDLETGHSTSRVAGRT